MKIRHIRIIICNFLMMAMLFYMGCACGGYKGDCFDVKINGVDVIPLTSESLTEPYQKIGLRADINATKWQVREPVDRKVDVEFAVNSKDGKEWIGEHSEMEVMIVPLENQVIQTDYVLSQADNVRIGGKAPVTATKIMKDNKLPPGNYLFKVRIRGSNNWDRKIIFVMVK